ncbi:MAG: sugar phosphate isomerase/epimerase [Chloroflexia bacterium]|nr:sugar phosphate isomerase/epimerase [Chloroflexia bacterium]
MLLSCVEHMLGGRSLTEKLAIVRAAGFDGIDVRWSTLADPAARGVLADSDLPIGALYSQMRDPCLLAARAEERARAVEGLVERAEAAVAIGAPTLIVVPIFGPAKLRGFDPLFDVEQIETALLLATLTELAERVANLPVTITIEPLNHDQTHFLVEPAKAAKLCAAIGAPLIATMVDTYHCEREGQDIIAQIEATGDKLDLVHLSDTDRKLPGEGTIDFGPVLAALRARNYDGWMGFEGRVVDDPADLARSVAYIRGLT